MDAERLHSLAQHDVQETNKTRGDDADERSETYTVDVLNAAAEHLSAITAEALAQAQRPGLTRRGWFPRAMGMRFEQALLMNRLLFEQEEAKKEK